MTYPPDFSPFSGPPLEDVVKGQRLPLRPSPIADLDDLKSPQNSILLNYLISDQRLSADHLAELLVYPNTLNAVLGSCVPVASPSFEPRFRQEPESVGTISEVAAAVDTIPGRFASTINFDSSRGDSADPCVLVADEEAHQYTFPSGRRISYSLLRNEVSANVSVFDGGYTKTDVGTGSPSFFVRENFVLAMCALAKAAKRVSRQLLHWEYSARIATGVVLAHEMGHQRQDSRNPPHASGFEIELAAERNGKELFVGEGGDELEYGIHHTLRAAPERYNPLDVSRAVLES